MDLDGVERLLIPGQTPGLHREDEVAAGAKGSDGPAYCGQIQEHGDRQRPGPKQRLHALRGMAGHRDSPRFRMRSRSKRRSTISTSTPTTSISKTANAAPSGQFWA